MGAHLPAHTSIRDSSASDIISGVKLLKNKTCKYERAEPNREVCKWFGQFVYVNSMVAYETLI